MKKLLLWVAASVGLAGTAAAADTLRVNTNIDEVMVYASGAMVQRSGTLRLPAGVSVLAVEGLSRQMNAYTLQVALPDAAVTVMSVTADYARRDNPALKRQADRIDAALRQAEDSLSRDTLAQGVLNARYRLYLDNSQLGAQQAAQKVSGLLEMSNCYERELTALNERKIALEREIGVLTARVKALRAEREALGSVRQRYGRALITVNAASARASVPVRLSYMTSGAWWSPSYELRATGAGAPLGIVYNASVHQLTGEDWNQARLTLSTGDPSQDYTQPEFSPMTLRKPSTAAPRKVSAVRLYSAATLEYTVDADMEEANAAGASVPVETRSGAMATEFAIALPYTIPSDGKEYQVEIADYSAPAEYEYVVMPRQSRNVWLLARVPGYTDYSLVTGPAALFIDNVYQGDATINAESMTDTLSLSLGRDKAVLVKREAVKDYTARKTVGSTVKVQKAYDITLRNNKKTPVTLRVVDQYPVSSDSEIKVTLTETGGAVADSSTGRLTWNLTLAPGESRTLRMAYEVKYPKEYGYLSID